MANNKASQLVQARIINGEIQLYFNIISINEALNQKKDDFRNKSNKVIQANDKLVFTLKEKDIIFGEGDTTIVETDTQKDRFVRITEAQFDNIPFGHYLGEVRIIRNVSSTGAKNPDFQTIKLEQFALDISQAIVEAQSVSLKPAFVEPTADKSFWNAINNTDLDFKKYKQFIDLILCTETDSKNSDVHIPTADRERFKNRLPFLNVDEYALIKFATDRYLQKVLRLGSAAGYFGTGTRLPYFDSISDNINDILGEYTNGTQGNDCTIRKEDRIDEVPLLELIWSFWMDQAYLDQTMGVISLRFQNIRGPREIEPLARFDTNSLRTLSSMMWGYIQDEQHRTTLRRRTFEYQHAYNLTLIGKAVPRQQGVDNRSNFLAAFHHLLHQASIFYRDHDDMTRRADGFPLLTALREVHLLLAEGNHNAYYNMTWTSRAEMMVQQYLLAREETQRFLGGRPMVPYPEEWMDRVDTMKGIQGWDSTSVLHYFDLATSGEKLLLGVRYGNWADAKILTAAATNWAVDFRDHAMRYINAYRTVTGVDLSADAFRNSPAERAAQPSALILRRLQSAPQPMAIPQRQQQRVAVRRY